MGKRPKQSIDHINIPIITPPDTMQMTDPKQIFVTDQRQLHPQNFNA